MPIKLQNVRRWVLPACLLASPTAFTQTADIIFLGQHILSMDPAPEAPGAVAIANGRILAVGQQETVMAHQGEKTCLVELGEAALLPGFIDAHGHFLNQTALLDLANLSPPPVGTIRSIADLQAALAAFIEERAIPAGQWVVGFGYDDSLLLESRHPDRYELDAVSTAHPVFLIHGSGHLGVLNSTGLEKLGINASTEDPSGGVIRRLPGSQEPDGVLEETAVFTAYQALPKPPAEQVLQQLPGAQRYYASHGITTVQEGAATQENVSILETAAKQGSLFLDVVAYPMWTPGSAAMPALKPTREYTARFRIGGIKLILDGSPQGKTAYLSQPYYKPPPGQPADYRGYPAYSDETVFAAVGDILASNIPLLAHANGDAAAEQLIAAVAAASESFPVATARVVMIHAQTVRDDQLDRMLELGMLPSFFSAHTFFWGDWHRESVLGPVRADRISPTASAVERGMVFTVHNDAPVTPPTPVDLVWSTVTRRTRSGDILGPSQRISTLDALKAVTIHAAYQYFEEDSKGSITPGKWADLVILSADPLQTDRESLRSLEVVETFSHGKSVFRRDGVDAPACPTPAQAGADKRSAAATLAR